MFVNMCKSQQEYNMERNVQNLVSIIVAAAIRLAQAVS